MFVSIDGAFRLQIKTGTILVFVKVFEAQGSGRRSRSVPRPGWKWIGVHSPARSAHPGFPKCQQVFASSVSHCRQTSRSMSATNQANQCHPHIYASNVRFLGPKFGIRCTFSPLRFKIGEFWYVFGIIINKNHYHNDHSIFYSVRFICHYEYPHRLQDPHIEAD